MGVTSEHPLFVAGQGWLTAGDVSAGDAVRDADLQTLTVLYAAIAETPEKVHNLEVADAHTYFAGEFEAWGHNGLGYYILEFEDGFGYIGKGCPKRMNVSIREKVNKYGSPLASKKWFPAGSDAASFIGEHLEMENATCPLRNKIAGPGKKLLGR